MKRVQTIVGIICLFLFVGGVIAGELASGDIGEYIAMLFFFLGAVAFLSDSFRKKEKDV